MSLFNYSRRSRKEVYPMVHRSFLCFFTLSTCLTPLVGQGFEGAIRMDGSSTLYPLNEAIAEEFQKIHPKIRISIGVSGTGGGFKKLNQKDVDLIGASRPITEKEKLSPYQEVPIALDGVTLVTHRENPLQNLSLADLKKIWSVQSQVKTWQDVFAHLPKQKIRLYGPGPDSGTFDFFTEKVNGQTKSSRGDYTASEDDHMLAKVLSQDRLALGYLGYAYFEQNAGILKAIPIDGISPTPKTIQDRTYPLSRVLYLYVSQDALAHKPQVRGFLDFYKAQTPTLARDVLLIPWVGSPS
jgi:phosphate transport system substrate-binding protein